LRERHYLHDLTADACAAGGEHAQDLDPGGMTEGLQAIGKALVRGFLS
jgi:hypothetical protein